jgi:ATP-binding cassette, subfamily B, bacterial
VSETEDKRVNLSELYLRGVPRRLTRLPNLMAGALKLVWRSAPREFTAFGFLQLIAGAALAAQVLIVQRVLARVLALETGGQLGDVLPWLVLLAAVSATNAFTAVARAERQTLLGELVARYAVGLVLEVSASVDLLSFERPSFHNRLTRALTNAGMRPAQMATGLLGLISGLITIVGVGFALLLIEPLFLLFVAVGYIPLWLVTTRASKVSYAFSVAQTERDRRRQYLSYVLSRRDEAAEVRAFGLMRFLKDRWEGLYDERMVALRTMLRRRLRYGLLGSLATSALNAAGLGVVVWFVSSGRLELAQAGAAAGALLILSQRLSALAGSAGNLFESSLFIEDFTTFLDVMPVVEAERPTALPPAPFSDISVEDVSFTYPSGTVPALEGISLEIHAGEVIALVGENGSGKTTLAKILAGLYQPSSGSVRWDGVDIATCDPELVSDGIGIIFQDYVKYMLTARENIVLGRAADAHDLEALHEAAQRAAAEGFLADLPDGYETQLGSEYFGGSQLSIGQWQRVALARAFFRDAPLLILDEPTAALDPRSEAELFDKIHTLYQGRTVVLISHRFSTVRSADRIFVLDRGRIVESGPHEELIAKHGLYAELFELQARAYLDTGDVD